MISKLFPSSNSFITGHVQFKNFVIQKHEGQKKILKI